MERCAYLVNSTPKYYGILPLHFTLLRRYGWEGMPLFLATEEPNHPVCKQLAADGVELIVLDAADAGFLDSRRAALAALQRFGDFDYVIPVQDDFLLDRAPNMTALLDAMKMIVGPIVSARLMPCPGPGGLTMKSGPSWAGLTPQTDTYGFTFQATMWRLDACLDWYTALCAKLEAEWPVATTSVDHRRFIEVKSNFAENPEGQKFFWEFFRGRKQVHVGWRRAGPWSNAVYLCPWPYRPTAIVQGKLEPWAAELGKREGVPIVL